MLLAQQGPASPAGSHKQPEVCLSLPRTTVPPPTCYPEVYPQPWRPACRDL